jgi:hypothetical protein
MDRTKLTLDELVTLLKMFKKQQGEEFHLQSIGVFGSFARDEATPESDDEPPLASADCQRSALCLSHHWFWIGSKIF